MGYLNNSHVLGILFYGSSLTDLNNELSVIQNYALERFSRPIPPLSKEEAKEYISIIQNRLDKLQQLFDNNSPYFDHIYYLIIDKIRKFYHKYLGISKIQTPKVYKIYTDEDYRKSMYKENPDNQFVEMYINLVNGSKLNRNEKMKMINDFFEYSKRNINLENDYRILIKSKNIIKKEVTV